MMPLTPETLITAGKALYGPNWLAPLSVDLGVKVRAVARWAAGSAPIPEGIPGELMAIAKTRGRQIDELARILATGGSS